MRIFWITFICLLCTGFGVERLLRVNRSKTLTENSTNAQIANTLKAVVQTEPSLESDAPPKQLLEEFQAELVQQEAILPQTFRYPAAEVNALIKYSEGCAGPAIDRSKTLEKAWAWHDALCNKATLSTSFFANRPFIHPNGRSFAGWYIEQNSQKGTPPTDEMLKLLPYTNLGEWQRLIEVSAPWSKMAVLLAETDASTLIKKTPLLWGSTLAGIDDSGWSDDRQERRIKVYPIEVLIRRFSSVGLSNEPLRNIDPSQNQCISTFGNLCWHSRTDSKGRWLIEASLSLGIVLIVLALTAARLSTNLVRSKRQNLHDRETMFRLLTHEIRTPIAAIKLQLEPFRNHFDALVPAAQDAFLSISSEVERARRVIEMSEAFVRLSAKERIPFQSQTLPSVLEFLTDTLETLARHVTIKMPAGDFSGSFDPFWIGVCIQNLALNGVLHGTPPVVVKAEPLRPEKSSTKCEAIRFSVSDAGRTFNPDLAEIELGNSTALSSKGLGIGLWLVNDILKRMQAEFSFTPQPSTFAIVLQQNTSSLETPHDFAQNTDRR